VATADDAPPSLFPVTLDGDRIRLREFTEDDLDRVWQWGSKAEFFRYLPIEPPSSYQEQRYWLDGVLKEASTRPRRQYQLGIDPVEGSGLIGAVRIGIEPGSGRAASIGYGIHPDLWGQGYATEATRLIIAFGFQSLRLHRIWATYHQDNLGSGRVLAKVGMRQEGRLRHHRVTHDVWYDSIICSILEDEWCASQ
jgi:[ribosomal protein S5]-alanine N-acetyltransferase